MTDTRKDIPPVNSPTFNERVRETLAVYLGNRGDRLDRGVTLRDLRDAGIIRIDPAYLRGGVNRPPILDTGDAIPDGEGQVDLTPPPMPTGFKVSPAISHVLIQHDAPTYKQGHGHSRTVLYGTSYVSGEQPTFQDAVKLAEFSGTVYSHPSNPATQWHLWIKWKSVDGVESSIPAGGLHGLVAVTGQNVGLLLTALSDTITSTQLSNDLNSRIDLIDGGLSTTILPGTLIELAAEQEALKQKLRRDFNDISADLLNNILKISETKTLVSDAGIYVDPADGTVKIAAIQTTADSLKKVSVDLDAAKADINLKASYTYVDNAVATAVLDPTSIPVFSELEARINTVEVDLNAEKATIALKANTLDLDSTNVRMTTAENNITSLTGQISNKVSTATYTADITGPGGLSERLGTAENTLTSLGDTSQITQLVSQSYSQYRDDNKDAETLLRAILSGDTETRARTEAIALAKTELTATVVDAVTAEANERKLLAVQVANNVSAIQSEQTARIAADSAEASARVALETAVNANHAELITNYYTKSGTDGAIASYTTSLQAYADDAANARVVTLEQTKIGYATKNSDGSVFDNNGAITDAAGVTAWNTANPSNQLTWHIGLPLATAVKQVSVSDGTSTASIESRFIAQKNLNDDLTAEQYVKIDVNGYVSGYGLYSSGATSDFIANVNRFSVTIPDSALATRANGTSYSLGAIVKFAVDSKVCLKCVVAGTTGGSAPSSTGTVGSTVVDGTVTWQYASRVPFAVLGTSLTYKGSTIPSGVYMDGAFIQNATITNAQIADATIDDAKIATLSASKITAGDIAVGRYIQSTGFTSGSTGWQINGNGTAEFAAAHIRGQLVASQIDSSGLSIKKADGTVVLNATSGDFTGTLNGTSTSTVVSNANNALSGTARNVLAGSGGLAVGSLTWNSSGVRTSGDGIGITANGVVAYYDGNPTFILNSNGTATFAGGLSAATGTFAGSLSAATGTFAGSLSAASGTFAGSLSAATGTFSGTLTADAVNAVNTLNIAGNAVTVMSTNSTTAGSGTTSVSTSLTIPANRTVSLLVLGTSNGDGIFVTNAFPNPDYSLTVSADGSLIKEVSGGIPTKSKTYTSGETSYNAFGLAAGAVAVSGTASTSTSSVTVTATFTQDAATGFASVQPTLSITLFGTFR